MFHEIVLNALLRLDPFFMYGAILTYILPFLELDKIMIAT